jgi:inorganic triphosphatase YgiF
MTETELKFQVPAARRKTLAAAVDGRSGAATQRLQAVYLDTAERALARAGIALRLRREGRHWVQTLKAAGSDRLQRLEHNVPRTGSTATPPEVDLALHVGTPAGERLGAVLRDMPAAVLLPLYRTDIRRRQRRLRTRGGSVELAFDQGYIVAGERRLPVCELEIELVSGAPQAVLDQAHRWVERHGLWLDVRSKAERGDLLARGEEVAPAAMATAPALSAAMDLAQGRRTVLAACAEQVLANASQVASGQYGDEHVHQLRVGLRRLRTALRLFDGDVPGATLAEGAALLFRQLGAARDQAAIGGPLRVELQQAMAGAGLALEAPALPAAADSVDPAECVRAPAAQRFLLDLIAALQPGPPAPDGADLREALAQRLQRWHRQVAADAPRFAALDDEARHRLRKRVKRLRYAVEFAAALFEARRVRRYLKPLRALQDRLGVLNDVAVGLQGFRGVAAGDAAAAFALGWLAQRRERLLAECVPALETFAAAKRFWKR